MAVVKPGRVELTPLLIQNFPLSEFTEACQILAERLDETN
jgi:hypothetical protein